MKTVLTLAIIAVATSLAVSHVATAQDRSKRFQRGEASLVETISNHFQRCWFPPEELGDQQALVAVRFGLFRDGSLRAGPTIVKRWRMISPDFRVAAKAAQRAVLECTPLEGLPMASYQQWREIELVFGRRAESVPSTSDVPEEQVRVTVLREREPYDGFEVDAVGEISGTSSGGNSTASSPSSGSADSPSSSNPSADNSPNSGSADSPSGGTPSADNSRNSGSADSPSSGTPSADNSPNSGSADSPSGGTPSADSSPSSGSADSPSSGTPSSGSVDNPSSSGSVGSISSGSSSITTTTSNSSSSSGTTTISQGNVTQTTTSSIKSTGGGASNVD